MQRILVLLSALASGVMLSVAGAQRHDVSIATASPVVRGRVDSIIWAEMARRHIPGLQLAVVAHGTIVKSSSYGLANVQDSIPVDSRTTFTINSITKAFVGVAVMQLVEDQRLDLDAPIARYLDELPDVWRSVTVRQLLTHTSGLPDIYRYNDRMVAEGSEDSAWVAVTHDPLEARPGEHFSYNQTNYLLLGRIIDRLSGVPFARFVTERQLRVVGMPRTVEAGFADARDVLSHAARGYALLQPTVGETSARATFRNVFEEFYPSLRTAAGMSSTATEMARWVMALQGGRLFTHASSLETLWTPGALNDGSHEGFSDLLNAYALGWPVIDREKHPAVAPVGGGRSAVFVYPRDGVAIIVLTNLQGSSPETFIDSIAAEYFRKP